MTEKDLNRIIVRSLSDIGMAHKISDESQNQKPFDYFGACTSFFIYGESKFLKGYQSFNFNRIRAHQLKALTEIHKTIVHSGSVHTKAVISLGIWESHKYFHVYFFDIGFINNLLLQGITSIKKKELLTLYEKNVYVNITKGKLEFVEKLPHYVISNF